MIKLNKLLSLVLALAMVLSMTTALAENAASTEKESILVYATSTFGQKFSPFFATTAYDMEVVDLTQIGLLAADRGGAVINEGIAGTDVDYNGTNYNYKGAGNVEVIMNDDGSVDYNLTMRDDIVFSDGTPATIDDVIFGVYVLCDPTYDGSSTIYAGGTGANGAKCTFHAAEPIDEYALRGYERKAPAFKDSLAWEIPSVKVRIELTRTGSFSGLTVISHGPDGLPNDDENSDEPDDIIVQ